MFWKPIVLMHEYLDQMHCVGYLTSKPGLQSQWNKVNMYIFSASWQKYTTIFASSVGSGGGQNECSCTNKVHYVLEGTSNVQSGITTDLECCNCCVQNDTCLGYSTLGSNENSVTCTTFTSVSGLTSTPQSGSDVSTAFLCKQNCSASSKCWWL